MKFYFERSDKNLCHVPLKSVVTLMTSNHDLVCEYINDFAPVQVVERVKYLFVEGSIRISDDYWLDLVNSIRAQSSPGVDFCYIYPTNSQLLEKNPALLRRRVEEGVTNLISSFRSCGSLLEVETLFRVSTFSKVENKVALGLDFPVRTFVKKEVTKISKEPRIIYSQSIEASCIEKLPLLLQFDSLINNWGIGPSSIGISLQDQSLISKFRSNNVKRLISHGCSIMNSDFQGFEYSFNQQIFEIAFRLEWQFRFHCGFHEETFDSISGSIDKMLTLINHHNTCSSKMIINSDGVVLHVDRIWLLSGRFKTSFYGTLVRSFLPTVINGFIRYVKAVSNGDDCLEELLVSKDDYLLRYGQWGFKVTDTYICGPEDPLHFCSQIINVSSHYPESVLKSLLTLFNHKVIDEQLYDQFRTLFVNSPYWRALEKLLEAIIEPVEILRA